MRYFCLYLFLACCTLRVWSQDSLPNFQFIKPVKVLDSLSRKDAVVATDIHKHYFALDLGSVLSQQSTMNIVQYGAPGSASLIRSQGLAPDHTALVWGNLSLNSISLGQADCSLIPSFFFDNISSSPFFSNQFKTSALSGDIILSNVDSDEHSYSFLHEWTSLNNQFVGIKVNESFDNTKLDIRVFHQDLNNQFDYRDTYLFQQPIVSQHHNNARGSGASIRAGIFIPQRGVFRIEYWTVHRDANLPWRMGTTNARNETQSDFQHRARVQWKGLRSHWSHQISGTIDQQNYEAQWAGKVESTIQSELFSNRVQASSEYDRVLGKKENYHVHGGAAAVYQMVNYLNGNKPEEYFLSAQFSVIRLMGAQQLRLSGSYETRENKPFPDFLVTYRRRTELVGLRRWNWFMEAGIQSRVPDYNERFWSPGGNPNLQPEINRIFRGGLEYMRRSHDRLRNVELNAKPYFNSVVNWIQWLPGADGFWSPQNFKEVFVFGLGLNAEYTQSMGKTNLQLNQAIDLCKSEAFNSNRESEKFEMVYTPRMINRTGLTLRYSIHELGLTYQYTSDRYTDEENSEVAQLSGYEILSAWIGWKYGSRNFDTSIRLKCENMLNEQYQSARLYAMPGRIFSVSAVITIKNIKHDK
jgi:vitamin B12 transporter